MPLGGIALFKLLMLAQKTSIDPLLHIYTVSKAEIEPDNYIKSSILQHFVGDALFTNESWVINRKVKCEHKIIRVTGADIDFKTDLYKRPIYIVRSINFELVKRLNKNAFERVFEQVVKEKIDLRLMLYLVEWDEKTKRVKARRDDDKCTV